MSLGFGFIYFFCVCVCSNLLDLSLIDILLLLAFFMVIPLFRMFACSYSGSAACSGNVGFYP